MKAIFTLIFLVIASSSFSQTGPIMDFAEVEPQFPGGEEAMKLFLKNNTVYPQTCIDKGQSGTVYIQFVVFKDGSLGNFKIMRKTNSALDDEALRVSRAMPNWIPGQQKGKKVNVRYTLPFTFSLEDTTPKSKKELRAERKRQKELLKHNK